MKLQTLIAVVLCAVPGAYAAQDLKTEVVAYREVGQIYSVDGVVEAVKQSTVASQISGRIVAINFDAGDRVKQGAVIVRIDEREAGIEVLAGLSPGDRIALEPARAAQLAAGAAVTK